VLSGTFLQNDRNIRSFGDVVNLDTLTIFDPPLIDGTLTFRPNPFTLTTQDGSVFGNIFVNSNTSIIELNSDVVVQRLNYGNGRINLQDNNLRVNLLRISPTAGTANFNGCGGCLSVEDMFITDGNASDGGLTLVVNASGNNPGTITNSGNSYYDGLDGNDYLFPLGFGTSGDLISSKYLPLLLSLSDAGDVGADGEALITVNPVQGDLQTTDLDPMAGDILNVYWRVRLEGFDSPPTVDFVQVTGVNDDVPNSGNIVTEGFEPGFVLDGNPFTRNLDGGISNISTLSDTDRPGQDYDIFFDGGTTPMPFQLNSSNFTAGDNGRFVGGPQIFFTRKTNNTSTTANAWSNSSTWSFTETDGPANTGGQIPGAGDVVIFGAHDSDVHGFPSEPIRLAVDIDTEVAGAFFEEPEVGESRARVFPREGTNHNWAFLGGSDGEIQLFFTQTSDVPTFDINSDLGEVLGNTSSTWNLSHQGGLGDGANLVTMPAFPAEFPTLRVTGSENPAPDDWNDRNILTFQTDIQVNNNLQVANTAGLLVTNDITTVNNLDIGVGFGNGAVRIDNAEAHTITVGGDLRINGNTGSRSGDSFFEVEGGGTNIEHRVIVNGNIQLLEDDTGDGNDAFLDLFSASGADNAILEIAGSEDATFTSSTNQIAELYRIVVNKGSDTSSVFSANADFNLLGSSNGSTKALELQNGLFVVNNAGVDIDINTGGDDFQIPSSAGLEIAAGEANVNGDDTGIFLDGTLRINGGTLDMSSGPGNGNNFIEYSASGNALLEISAGTLNVGSQIRRGLSSTTGVLNYTQTGGDVTLGINAAPETNRGVLEILNTGSNLTLTGGSLTLVRQNGANPSAAALRLSPTTFDVTGSTINVFNASTPANQTSFGINASIPLNNLTIGGNGNNPAARIFVNPLVVNGNLTVDANGTFQGNGLDLAVNGGFNINGTYLGDGNNTLFTTNSTQTLNAPGTADFFSLLKSGTGTLSVADVITIENFLNISQGTVDDLGNTILARGNVEISGTHVSTGADPVNDRGLVFEGTTSQTLTTAGSGTKNMGLVTINNSNGVSIPDGAQPIQFTNGLRLQSGRFDIGGNLVITAPDVPIEAVSPFSVNNMIRTNNSIIDQGLRRDFNAISALTTLEFPVGEQNFTGEFIFTPITFEISDSDDGSLRVRPLNEIHPSIVEDSEAPNDEIGDVANALQYHWIIRPTGISDFTGTATFKYEESDVALSGEGPPYTEDNYTVARLSNTSDTWDRAFGASTVDAANNEISFQFTNENDVSISGDYTAGVNAIGETTINGAIPLNVPTLNTNNTGGGDFSDPSTWEDGVTPTGGEIINVVGNDILVFDQTGSRVLRTSIGPNASVTVNPDVFGIRIGVVSGPGNLRLSNEVLPAGDYADFFDCSSPNAGGLEYFGTTDYSILAGISEVRNVTVSGSGERTLPNGALQVCESMVINGPDVVKSTAPTVQIDQNFELQSGSFDVTTSTTINIDEDFLLTAGSFDGANNLELNIGGDMSRGTASVSLTGTNITLNGSSLQNITGDWNGANAIDDLTLNNSGAGFDVGSNNTVQIDGLLTFTDGIISTSNTDSLVLNASATISGGSTASHVNGPLSKVNIPTNGNFRFPVGKVGRYREVQVFEDASTGGSDWTAEYFTVNSRGTSDFNTISSTFGTLTTISDEMWTVTGLGGASPIDAQVQLMWGPESGVVDPDDIRIVFWDDKDDGPGANDEWFNIGEGLQAGSSAMMGSIRSQVSGGVDFSSNDFTLGSVDDTALPVELVEFTAQVVDGNVVLKWTTATEIDNSHFEIERAGTDRIFNSIGEVAGNGNAIELIDYNFTDYAPFSGVSYYRLKQVDFDGDFEYSAIVSIEVETGLTISFYPNPIVDRRLNLLVNGLGPEQNVTYSIMNKSGRIIDSGTLQSDGGTVIEKQLEFDDNLTQGIYILIVEAGGIIERKRIIVH
jgi:hypothetical protein